jgi:hypothetical protein
LAASVACACDPREVVSTTDGGMRPAASSNEQDAGSKPVATGGAPAPNPFWFDGGLLPDTVCSLHVGATCDGQEDCEHGRVCCGEFDPRFVTYRSIGCKESCNGQDEFEFCHTTDECRSGYICRRSLIAPYDFLGVCVQDVPSEEPVKGARVAGEVTCGANACDARTEQCCLRMQISLTSPPAVLAPFCQPRDAACDCDQEAPLADAGPDDDAGR